MRRQTFRLTPHERYRRYNLLCQWRLARSLAFQTTSVWRKLQHPFVLLEQFWLAGDDAYSGSAAQIITPYLGHTLPDVPDAFK